MKEAIAVLVIALGFAGWVWRDARAMDGAQEQKIERILTGLQLVTLDACTRIPDPDLQAMCIRGVIKDPTGGPVAADAAVEAE